MDRHRLTISRPGAGGQAETKWSCGERVHVSRCACCEPKAGGRLGDEIEGQQWVAQVVDDAQEEDDVEAVPVLAREVIDAQVAQLDAVLELQALAGRASLGQAPSARIGRSPQRGLSRRHRLPGNEPRVERRVGAPWCRP